MHSQNEESLIPPSNAPPKKVEVNKSENSNASASPHQLRWKHAFEVVKDKHLADADPWAEFLIEAEQIQLVTTKKLHINFDLSNETRNYDWEVSQAVVKVQDAPFGEGAMRECYRLKKLPQQPGRHFHALDWKHANNYVAKRYKKIVSNEVYENDVKLQMEASYWAHKYNLHKDPPPPKKIDMINVYLMEFSEKEGKPVFCVERFIDGDYIKHNSNSGFVDEHHRMTPQAFSHFTFQESKGELMVVDIQGVGDLYTDPQIHSRDQHFGEGDLGVRGMALFFRTHQCSPLCEFLGMPTFPLSGVEMNALGDTSSMVSEDTMISLYSNNSQPASRSASQHPSVTSQPEASVVRSEDSILALSAVTERLQSLKFLQTSNDDALISFNAIDSDTYHFAPIHVAIAQQYLKDPAVSRDQECYLVFFHISRAAKLGDVNALEALANLYSGTPHALLPPDLTSHPVDEDRAGVLWTLAADAGSIPGICRVATSLIEKKENIEKVLAYFGSLLSAMDEDQERFEEQSFLRPYEIKAEMAKIYSGKHLPEKDMHLKDIDKAIELYNDAAEDAMADSKMKKANEYITLASSL